MTLPEGEMGIGHAAVVVTPFRKDNRPLVREFYGVFLQKERHIHSLIMLRLVLLIIHF